MNDNEKRTAQAVAVLCAAMLTITLARCQLLEGDPPFRYLSASLVKGGSPDCHDVVGIHYSIRNVSGRVIAGMRATFTLYDDSGHQMPMPGHNRFDISYSGAIPPDTSWEICTSLDGSFYYLPDCGLVADGFRIYRVEFDGGGFWSDPLALYAYPYEITTDDFAAQPEETG